MCTSPPSRTTAVQWHAPSFSPANSNDDSIACCVRCCSLSVPPLASQLHLSFKVAPFTHKSHNAGRPST